MLSGHVDALSRRGIAGWAVDLSNLDREIEVAVFIDDVEYARVTANLPRADLKRLGKFGSGNHGFSVGFQPELTSSRGWSLQVRFAETGQVVPKGVGVLLAENEAIARISFSDADRMQLVPILVTAIGRSGTTILMQKLSMHDRIAVARKYPFEVKLSTYYAHALDILAGPADHKNSLHPDNLEEMRHHVGSNPYFSSIYDGIFLRPEANQVFFEQIVHPEMKQFFLGLLDRFYSGVARDQKKAAATYFAEKSSPDSRTCSAIKGLFREHKNVLLVRDLRDVYCSSKSYFAAEQISRLLTNLKAAQASLLRMADVGTSLVIRYEDLLNCTAEALLKLSNYLELEPFSDDNDGSTEARLFAVHGTSASVKSSIGRWRNDMSDQEKEFCRRELGPFFARFGYPSS